MGLKQLIKVPTWLTSNTSTLIDHVLTSSNEKVVQASITKTVLTIKLLFATSKIKRKKPNKHNCLTFCSMGHFPTDCCEEALSMVIFPNYGNFSWQKKWHQQYEGVVWWWYCRKKAARNKLFWKFKNSELGRWNLIFSIAFPTCTIKKLKHYLILLKEHHILSFYLKIFWTQKIFDIKPIQWVKNNVSNI